LLHERERGHVVLGPSPRALGIAAPSASRLTTASETVVIRPLTTHSFAENKPPPDVRDSGLWQDGAQL